MRMSRLWKGASTTWRTGVIEAGAIGAMAVLSAAGSAAGQGTRMRSVDDFLMERSEEIALARSAGPRGIGEAATVLVMTRRGYEVAAEGTNGFVCFVGRGWSGPGTVADRGGRREVAADLLDPAIRAPHCFNAEAAETVLKWHLLMTESLISGEPAEGLPDVTAAALQSGKLRAPGQGAVAYMTSPHQYLGAAVGRWHPHVMLYLPYSSNDAWGSKGFNAEYPFVAAAGTTWSVVVIPIERFSDGEVAR